MPKMRRGKADLEYPLYERDADLTARACARSLNYANQHDWPAALESADEVIRILERSNTPSLLDAQESGHHYLHFSGPFPAEVYRRFVMPEDEDLHIVLDDFSLLYEAQGQALRRLARHAEAVEAFTKACAWNPLSTTAAIGLIHALCETGRRDEARAKAVETLPLSLSLAEAAQLYAELALDAQRRGSDALAQALVMLALTLDPAAQSAYDLAVYYEYLTGRDRMELVAFPDAWRLVEGEGLLLAPDQRFCALALNLSSEAESAGNFGRAAYYVRCAMVLGPNEPLLSRLDHLYRKAVDAGQRTDGYDGFIGSGTFVSPAPATSAASGASGARTDLFEADPVQKGDEILPTAHDHRSDSMSVRGNGELPNAMGGMPGVMFPGQALPYDGSMHAGFRHRPTGRP